MQLPYKQDCISKNHILALKNLCTQVACDIFVSLNMFCDRIQPGGSLNVSEEEGVTES